MLFLRLLFALTFALGGKNVAGNVHSRPKLGWVAPKSLGPDPLVSNQGVVSKWLTFAPLPPKLSNRNHRNPCIRSTKPKSTMPTHRSLANDANEHPSLSIPTEQTSPATAPPITDILAPAVSCTVTGHHMTTHRAQGTGLRLPVASQATVNASSSNASSPVNAASSTASSPVNAAPSSTECTQHPDEADDDFPPIRDNQDVPTGLQPGGFIR